MVRTEQGRGEDGGYTYPSVWEIKLNQFISTVIQLCFHLSDHSPSALTMKGR